MGFRAGVEIRRPLAAAGEGPRDHGHPDAGAGHRRQRRHLQPGALGAAAPARQPRRAADRLHPPERARHRQRKHRPSRCRRSRTSASACRAFADVAEFSTVVVHDGRPRRAAAGARRRRQRQLLRGDGAAAGARPPARPASDDGAGGGRCGGADAPLLDDGAQQRSGCARQDHPARARGRATIVGVLEPSVPYPAETELIANVVTSPHHLSATMVTGREHRMTEVFARLAPAARPRRRPRRDQPVALRRDQARLRGGLSGQRRRSPSATVPLRDQLTSNARTVLIVLFAASLLIFVIACSNVANLILARTVRRESELAVRAALGAARRRCCAERCSPRACCCAAPARSSASLLAWPMVGVLSRYAARFSVRALEVDGRRQPARGSASLLALVAAVLLAFVPTLPSADRARRAEAGRAAASASPAARAAG